MNASTVFLTHQSSHILRVIRRPIATNKTYNILKH